MNLKQAKAAAREVGCSLKSTEFGEYRVNLSGGKEATAYYTTDIDDAVGTARAMAAWKDRAERKRIPVQFTTSEYRFSHGREPRGYGAWAFEINGGAPVFAPASTLAAAKTWAKEQARATAPAGTGALLIKVCP